MVNGFSTKFLFFLVPLRIVAQDASSRSTTSSNIVSESSNVSTWTAVSTAITSTSGPIITVDGERSTVTAANSVSALVSTLSSTVPGPVQVGAGNSASSSPSPLTSSANTISTRPTSASSLQDTTPTRSSKMTSSSSLASNLSTTLLASHSSSTIASETTSSIISTTSPQLSATSQPLSATSQPLSVVTSMMTMTSTSMMTMTAAPSASGSSRLSNRQRKVTIALSVVLGVLFLTLVIFATFFFRRWHRRRMAITRTGNEKLDAEIEGWRSSKGTTEGTNLTGGDRRSSTSQREWDDEKVLQRPPTAKAPNARSGLTDSMVPGAEPFIHVRRNSSKLQKRSSSRPGSRPGSLLGHQRSISNFSLHERQANGGDRPLTPREPIIESLAEKEAPPLPADAEETIRNSLGSAKSHRVSGGKTPEKRISA